MRLLLLDKDFYVSTLWLLAYNKGGAVRKTSAASIVKDFKDDSLSDVVIDISAEPLAPDAWAQTIRDLVGELSITGRQLVVFTALEREDIDQIFQCAEVPLGSYRYYSKSRIEIPPELKDIRDEILVNPYLIGESWRDCLPKQITPEWIRESEARVGLIGPWIGKAADECSMAIDDFLQKQPIGMRRSWCIIRMDSDIVNGGLGQFLGNDDEDPTRAGSGALEALQAFGCHELSAIIREAVSLWRTFCERASDSTDFEGSEAELRFRELERDYSHAIPAAYVVIGDYMQRHADEWCI